MMKGDDARWEMTIFSSGGLMPIQNCFKTLICEYLLFFSHEWMTELSGVGVAKTFEDYATIK